MRRHTVPFLPRRFQALGDFFQDAPKLLPLMAAGVTGYYLGKSIPVMQLPLRLYLVFIGGAFMLFYTWKTGPFPGLLLAMLLVWTQHQYFNYPFIQPVLFEGPPPEVLVYTAFFIFLLKRRSVSAVDVPYLKPLLVFVLYSIALFLFGIAPDRHMSLLALRLCVIAPVLGYVLSVITLKNKKEIEMLVSVFLLGSIVLSVLSVAAYAGWFDIAEVDLNVAGDFADRFYAPYEIPYLGYLVLGGNNTVLFSSCAIAVCMGALFYRKGAGMRVAALFCLLANFSVLVISGSRMPFLAVFVSGMAIVSMGEGKAGKAFLRYALRILVILTGLTSTYLLLNRMGFVSDEVSERLASILPGIVSPVEYLKDTGGERYFIWQQIVPALMHNPLGTGFMESFAPAGGADVGPHSQYLFLLLGSGIAGTAAFIFFLVSCMRRLFRSCKEGGSGMKWVAAGAGGSIVVWLVNSLSIHSFVAPGADIMLLVICGAGLAALRTGKGPENASGDVRVQEE
ncbi:MAG: O-antigen ligase family protein [Nitrospiraceae bacterium]|nr:O-antigen ligase family protein [Nitrospiraceae bacterium]